MDKPWKELKVGDRVRIVRLPSQWEQPGYYVPEETRRLYEVLIARKRPVRVFIIDEWRSPWIECRTRDDNGDWLGRFLLIGDDRRVKVEPRKPKP